MIYVIEIYYFMFDIEIDMFNSSSKRHSKEFLCIVVCGDRGPFTMNFDYVKLFKNIEILATAPKCCVSTYIGPRAPSPLNNLLL